MITLNNLIFGRKKNKNYYTLKYGDSCELACQAPTNCVVSDWSDWSACIDSVSTRTRTVIIPASNDGIACPVLIETESCVLPPPVPQIPCDGSLKTNGAIGYYELTATVGTNTGLTYIDCFAGNIPDRFQIYWNNNLVADSLFIGNYLNNSTYPYTRSTYVNTIIGTRTYYKYIYVGTGGDRIGGQWNTNGSQNITFTSAEISSDTSTRSSGGSSGQLNVSANYPTPTAKSCDGDVRLYFNKTSAFPETIKIVIIGANTSQLSGGTTTGTTGWEIKKVTCP